MSCLRCGGTFLSDWGERVCVNCGERPDVIKRIGTLEERRGDRGGGRRFFKRKRAK